MFGISVHATAEAKRPTSFFEKLILVQVLVNLTGLSYIAVAIVSFYSFRAGGS